MPRPYTGPKLKANKRRNGVFEIHYNDEAGRRRQKSTGTRDIELAQDCLAEHIRLFNRASNAPRDPAQFSILDAMENYALGHAPHTKDPARIGHCIKALAPFWGDLNVSDITEETCRAYQRERKVSDGTVRRELSCLRAAIRYEHRHGRLTREVHVWLPAKPPGKDRWLTRREAASLLNAARNEEKARFHLPLFILLGLYTGARKAAILELRWYQVDLDKGIINFNQKGRVQTKKKRPIIPIPDKLLPVLKRASLRGSELGYVINIDGKPVGNIKRSFATACKKANITDATPNTLRHTAGTWMAQGAVPLWQIAGWLGHSHETTTQLYSHHHPDYFKEAKEAFK